MASVARPKGSNANPTVLVVGHPLLDMVANVDPEFLERYDIAPGSVSLATARQQNIFTDIMGGQYNVTYSPGGSAMNTARVLKWMYPNITSIFVGAIGNDDFGRLGEQTLKELGVQALFERNDDVVSGTCAALIVDKERSLITNLGAALHITLEHMRSVAVQKAIAQADVFYIEGFFFNTISSPLNVMILAQHAAVAGKLVCFNLSAPYVCNTFIDRIAHLIPYVSVLIGNSGDVMSFAQAMGWQDEDSSIQEVCLWVAQLPMYSPHASRLVVCTRGADSTFVATSSAVHEFPTMYIPPENIVDDNGAGDAFAGGFLGRLLEGASLAQCVESGQTAAGVVLRTHGVTLPTSFPPTSQWIPKEEGVRRRCSKELHGLPLSADGGVTAAQPLPINA